jgi:hypothetical protein
MCVPAARRSSRVTSDAEMWDWRISGVWSSFTVEPRELNFASGEVKEKVSFYGGFFFTET